MKRFLLLAGLGLFLFSCTESSTTTSVTKDTVAPANTTTPTATNPGGLQANGADTTAKTDSSHK